MNKIYADQHVQKLDPNDSPDVVAIEVYITNAYRAYQEADHYRKRGTVVILGGLPRVCSAKMHLWFRSRND